MQEDARVRAIPHRASASACQPYQDEDDELAEVNGPGPVVVDVLHHVVHVVLVDVSADQSLQVPGAGCRFAIARERARERESERARERVSVCVCVSESESVRE